MTDRIEGIVPILVTPFNEDESIDDASLRALVEFNIQRGVHGIGVANGSELFKLNEAERAQVVRCVVDAADGRVPVVVSTGAAGTATAVQFSRAAEDAGADMVMVMPPAFMPVGPDGVVEYFRRIGDAIAIPICLQDMPLAPIPPALALRIARACERARYIKVETRPLTMKVDAMVRAAGDDLIVFGGASGTFFIEELTRGAVGTMPYCSQPEAFVEVLGRFRGGDMAGARELFDRRLMAINRLTDQGFDTQHHVHKQLLVRLGVIRGARVRSPTEPPDAATQKEIDALLQELAPEAKPFSGSNI